MSSNLVLVTTGHLGCGQWRIKQLDDLYFLAHPQPFSRRIEYRIGPDQVEAVEVEGHKGDKLLVKMDLTGDRYCRAEIHPDVLPQLESMASDHREVPLAPNQQTNWVIGLAVFILVCVLYELFK